MNYIPNTGQPQPSAPPAYNDQQFNGNVLNKGTLLAGFCAEHKIAPYIQEDLSILENYEIVIICDDSSSMLTPTENGTRWTELKAAVEIIVQFGGILDEDGVDIWFLNRSETPYKNIRSIDQVRNLFDDKPCGRTPLTATLKAVMDSPTTKPKIIFIATDGVPTNDDGQPDTDNFTKLLKNRNSKRNRITILTCTNDEYDTAFLNSLDDKIDDLDVTDDYITEKNIILKIQGSNFQYSYGDHIIKMLLGAVLNKYDDLNEKKIRTRGTGKNGKNKNKCYIL